MKQEIRYQWRHLWIGKWVTTRYHCTEEFIRASHPEAVRLDDTREVIMLRANCTSAFLTPLLDSDGNRLMGWQEAQAKTQKSPPPN